MNDVLFLTEAGTNIGFGHITRCAALHKFFRKNQINSLILLSSDINYQDTEIAAWVFGKDKVIKLSEFFNVVIIDSYIADKSYYQFLKDYYKNVIVLDDYNRISYSADYIINPGIFCSKVNYSNQKAQIIGGKNYVILRESFLEKGQNYSINSNLDTITITLGGSDYRNLLPKILVLLINTDYKINIITGNENYKSELNKLFSQENFIFYGFLKENEMTDIFVKSDLVISAAGQTLNELSYLGVPSISICIDEDQRLNLDSYFENKFILLKIFWDDLNFSEKIASSLFKLNNYSLRKNLSNNGKKLINGKGIVNIYKLIEGLN